MSLPPLRDQIDQQTKPKPTKPQVDHRCRQNQISRTRPAQLHHPRPRLAAQKPKPRPRSSSTATPGRDLRKPKPRPRPTPQLLQAETYAVALPLRDQTDPPTHRLGLMKTEAQRKGKKREKRKKNRENERERKKKKKT